MKAVAWQIRHMYDKGSTREKEWLDWRSTSEFWFNKTRDEIIHQNIKRVQVRALGEIECF